MRKRSSRAPPDGGYWYKKLLKTALRPQVSEKTQKEERQRGKIAEKAKAVVYFTITTSLLKYPMDDNAREGLLSDHFMHHDIRLSP